MPINKGFLGGLRFVLFRLGEKYLFICGVTKLSPKFASMLKTGGTDRTARNARRAKYGLSLPQVRGFFLFVPAIKKWDFGRQTAPFPALVTMCNDPIRLNEQKHNSMKKAVNALVLSLVTASFFRIHSTETNKHYAYILHEKKAVMYG